MEIEVETAESSPEWAFSTESVSETETWGLKLPTPSGEAQHTNLLNYSVWKSILRRQFRSSLLPYEQWLCEFLDVQLIHQLLNTGLKQRIRLLKDKSENKMRSEHKGHTLYKVLWLQAKHFSLSKKKIGVFQHLLWVCDLVKEQIVLSIDLFLVVLL